MFEVSLLCKPIYGKDTTLRGQKGLLLRRLRTTAGHARVAAACHQYKTFLIVIIPADTKKA